MISRSVVGRVSSVVLRCQNAMGRVWYPPFHPVPNVLLHFLWLVLQPLAGVLIQCLYAVSC